MKKLFFSLFLSIFLYSIGVSQTSDDAFKQPLRDVLVQIQKQYGIAIRYDEALIKDMWVTYAGGVSDRKLKRHYRTFLPHTT